MPYKAVATLKTESGDHTFNVSGYTSDEYLPNTISVVEALNKLYDVLEGVVGYEVTFGWEDPQ